MNFKSIILLLTGMIFSTGIFSQEAAPAKITVIKIKTSAQCGMCKDRLERAMAFEKGVVSSELNLEDKVLTVKYKPSRTTPDKIRKAISAVGHDADEVPADVKAYDNLPACCKKPADPAHGEHTDK